MKAWLAGSLLLVVCVLAVHWPPPDADFAYDDRDFVETNQALRSLAGGLAGFLLPFPPEQPERALYRPLTHLSYAVDYALFGATPRAFHATNVALYTLASLALLGLAGTYLGRPGFAVAVALLWALHPVHCEAVDAIAGRSELLALLFGLLSLAAWVRHLEPTGAGRGALALSAGCYALSCLSKESGAVLLPVLAVHAWALKPPPRGAGLRGWLAPLRDLAPHAVVLVGYLVLRTAVLGQFSPDAAILRGHGLAARLWTAGAVFAENLRLLVLPTVLQPDFYYQALIGIVETPSPRAVLGLVAATAALAGWAALAWRHLSAGPDAPHARERAVAVCAGAIFLVFLLPTSHVLDIGALLAERFLLAPSVGFVLLVVLAGRAGLRRLAAPPAVAIALVLVLAFAGAWRSHARALEWRDPVALWSAAARVLPDDVRVHTNLAATYLERGDLPAAKAHIDRALVIRPNHLPSLGNRGVLEMGEGRLDDAERTYQTILEIAPDDFLAWYNLGVIAMRRGQPALAAERFERALALNPNHAWSRTGLERARAAAQGDR